MTAEIETAPEVFDLIDRPESEPFLGEPEPPAEVSAATEPPTTTAEEEKPAAADATTEKPATAAPEPAKAEVEVDAGDGKKVPVAALVAERAKLRAEAARERADAAAARARASKLEAELAATRKTKEPEEPEPDYLKDPKGYVDAKVKGALDEMGKPVKEATEKVERVSGEQQFRNFLHDVHKNEEVFTASTPDYQEALVHARGVRMEQLKMVNGDAVTEDQLKETLLHEEIAFAQQALARGKNPAELIYAYAKSVGYRRAEALAAKPNGAAGAAAVVVPPSPPTRDPSDTLGPSGGDADPPMGSSLQGDDTKDILEEALKERFTR